MTTTRATDSRSTQVSLSTHEPKALLLDFEQGLRTDSSDEQSTTTDSEHL